MKALQGQLENETKSLSDQLAAERVTNQRLHIALTEASEQETILREQLDETPSKIVLENMDADSDGRKESKFLYPFKDLEHTKEIYSLEWGEAVM